MAILVAGFALPGKERTVIGIFCQPRHRLPRDGRCRRPPAAVPAGDGDQAGIRRRGCGGGGGDSAVLEQMAILVAGFALPGEERTVIGIVCPPRSRSTVQNLLGGVDGRRIEKGRRVQRRRRVVMSDGLKAVDLVTMGRIEAE